MFPGLVESGKVFKAIPPLYGIPVGKRMEYFAERVDFVRYMQKEFYKKNEVLDMFGKPVSATMFSRLLIENSDYVYDFKTVADRYQINPTLLEIILTSYIRKDKFEALRKRIVSAFRFMENSNVVKLDNGTIRIKGLINGRVETLFMNERFINQDCPALIEPVRKAMEENHMEFILNGNKVGLYDLVSAAMNNLTSVSRFKGLGEMDDYQLAESTMSKESRTLIQYTIDDIDESIRIIRQYDSNKKLILPKIANIDRGDLIGL